MRQLDSATAPEVARAHRQLKAAPDSAGKGPSICRSAAGVVFAYEHGIVVAGDPG